MRNFRFVALLSVVIAFSASAAGKAKKGGAAKPPPAAAAKPSPAPANRPPVNDAPQESASASSAPPTRGPTRIDFDDRLIQGQTNKSGAVYLYDRKELKTKSMIKTRDSFRDEIVGSLYDT